MKPWKRWIMRKIALNWVGEGSWKGEEHYKERSYARVIQQPVGVIEIQFYVSGKLEMHNSWIVSPVTAQVFANDLLKMAKEMTE